PIGAIAVDSLEFGIPGSFRDTNTGFANLQICTPKRAVILIVRSDVLSAHLFTFILRDKSGTGRCEQVKAKLQRAADTVVKLRGEAVNVSGCDCTFVIGCATAGNNEVVMQIGAEATGLGQVIQIDLDFLRSSNACSAHQRKCQTCRRFEDNAPAV